ncbi:MAG TPA: hypothetical protein VGL11_03240 [Candidatus Binatia bacterium]
MKEAKSFQLFLSALLPALAILALFVLPVVAADDESDTLVRFKGGIGVIPVTSGQGTGATATTVNRNIVRGVQPAGQIWVINDLDARVRKDGKIKVEGEGLILGGGNNVGRATGQRVFATLICEAAAPFTERNTNTAGVPLAANGDFEIDDVLTPAPPANCASPMLLIRNSDGLVWFAAGIPASDDDDD